MRKDDLESLTRTGYIEVKIDCGKQRTITSTSLFKCEVEQSFEVVAKIYLVRAMCSSCLTFAR